MSDNDKLGYECIMYYDATPLAAGETAVNGSWTELDAAKDVNLPLDKAEADMTSRKNKGWKNTRGGLKDASLTFEMIWDSTDLNIRAVRTAYMTNVQMAMAIMDGDIAVNDNEGFIANFEIMNFDFQQPLEEGVTIAVTAKPRTHQEWYKVGA